MYIKRLFQKHLPYQPLYTTSIQKQSGHTIKNSIGKKTSSPLDARRIFTRQTSKSAASFMSDEPNSGITPGNGLTMKLARHPRIKSPKDGRTSPSRNQFNSRSRVQTEDNEARKLIQHISIASLSSDKVGKSQAINHHAWQYIEDRNKKVIEKMPQEYQHLFLNKWSVNKIIKGYFD